MDVRIYFTVYIFVFLRKCMVTTGCVFLQIYSQGNKIELQTDKIDTKKIVFLTRF